MKFFSSIKNFILSIFLSIKNNTFLKDGLSIDETKVSAMVIAFLSTTIFALIMYILHGDITMNLLNFLNTLVYGITGVNVIEKLVNKVGENSLGDNPTPVNSITSDITSIVPSNTPVNTPIDIDNKK